MFTIYPNVCVNNLGTVEQPYRLVMEDSFQKPSSQMPGKGQLCKCTLRMNASLHSDVYGCLLMHALVNYFGATVETECDSEWKASLHI